MKKTGIYYLIFALSGFSGLIYESIWTHYLKLFLGHAAYAQTLVLAIFMGGMAFGAYVCSKYSCRWNNLLCGYALVEGIVGVLALIFHPVFDASINYAYATIIPALGSQFSVNFFKWTLATLSILPQSVLLGMTFPLMSGALLRRLPDSSGRSLAILYFANSIGAVFGVLASGFLLINLVGFPGTICFAGIINIALAIAVWFLSRNDREPLPSATYPEEGAESIADKAPRIYWLLLLVSLGTGAASFIYEIGWIRMLALVLGSSTHAFELMLSAFLLGLATGGLWIKKRIDTLAHPIRFLACIQIAMGLAALATLPMYNSTFPLMRWLVLSLPKTDTGYLLFNLGSYGIAAAIMLPATFCAGMTLPLITNILIRNRCGEKSIGAVYAANTVGAIVGIFGAVHLAMPALGLKGLLTVGAALDMALAVILVLCLKDPAAKRLSLIFAATCAATVTLVLSTVHFDPFKMASGVFREKARPLTREDTKLLFYKDGKTASISVAMAQNGFTNIRTNGKSDSEISLDLEGAYAPDEPTTILSGALPLFYKPDARSVAIIGLGTGLTTQTVLTNPNVNRVDTIEIEKAVIEGAELFRKRTDLVYTDRRSNIIIDDAKSAFSSYGRTYDVIISEPSNPWVSGVAGLFSEEFYRHVKRHLHDDGLFVQWIQLYEMDENLAASIFRAISKNFSDYTVYLTAGNAEIMVVARKSGHLPPLKADVLQIPAFRALLSKINVNGLQDIRIREVGTKQFLAPLFETYPLAANSDYFPVLDQKSAKARFMSKGAFSILRLAGGPLPYMHLLASDTASPPLSTVSIAEGCDLTLLAKRAAGLREYILTGRFPDDIDSNDKIVSDIVRSTAVDFRKMLQECRSFPENDRKELVSTAAAVMIPYLTGEELKPVWSRLESSCQSAMSGMEKLHFDLFKALSNRNFDRVATLAGEILTRDSQLQPGSRQYLVGIGMLAAIATGNRTEAGQLYQQQFGTNEQPDIIFRMLYAQASLQGQ